MKKKKLNEVIDGKKIEIIELSAKYGGSNIRIFGPYATEEATPDCDLDLLMDIESNRSLSNRIELSQELEYLLGIKVDIAKPENLHPQIRDEILREAIHL